MPMPVDPGFGGFADLGQVIAGGGAGSRDAYMKGAGQAASLETSLANARIKRDEALQREKLRERLAASGVPPEQADLLETVIRGGMGSDFSAGMTGLGTQQRNNYRDQAVTAGQGGDLDLMNVLLAGVQGTPMTTTQVDEGYVVNPHGSPDQTLGITEGELADIGANKALTTAREAQTSASNARAESIRDRTANPDKYKTPPKTKADDGERPPPAALKALARGKNTRFANGQTWTLDESGQPKRVK